MTARCKHDNIVDIYDIGKTPGLSCMVLEYLEGVTLRSWIADRWSRHSSNSNGAHTDVKDANNAPVSPTVAIELMVPVVRALAYAGRQSRVARGVHAVPGRRR